MNRLHSAFWLSVICSALLATSGRAQHIDLVGNSGWYKSGSSIQIYAERIENHRDSGTSGNLRLRIWATTNIYDGVSDIVGYVVGTLNVRPVNAGGVLANISAYVRFVRPPPGIYFTTMTLEEQTVDGYVIVDSENFTDPVNFGAYGEGSAHFDTDNGDVSFVGDISWLAGNNTVKIYAEEILNARPSGRSGILRIRLWATSTPYHGGNDVLQGYPMMTKRVGRVNAGQYIANYSRGTHFYAPARGEYYVTMTLEEYVGGLWNIVDFVTFDGKSIF